MKRLQTVLFAVLAITCATLTGCMTQTPTQANWQYWGRSGINAQRFIKGSPPPAAVTYAKGGIEEQLEEIHSDLENINTTLILAQ